MNTNTNMNNASQSSSSGSVSDFTSDPSQTLEKKLETMPDLLSGNNSSLPSVTPITAGTLSSYLNQAISLGASDLHITPGYRVMVRVNGSLRNLESPIINPSDSELYSQELLKNRSDLNFSTIKEVDLTYTISNRRFRVNIFKQMGSYSIVFRIIPDRIKTVDELGLPMIVKEFTKFSNGLVLVTGPTGSGKSTTIASLLNLINLTQPKHIITLEDPIEYLFPKGVGLVDQREFGIDFHSWQKALRSILRQDPDIVLIGEMRDLETVEAALQIAETGHLVFATLHTNGAAATIDRLIDIFPSTKQDQIKVQFASVIRAIVSQKLVKTLDSRRRIASEVLIANPAVKNAIRENKGYQIDNVIQTNSDMGMQSLERSLVNLVREGAITVETAKLASTRPAEIDILLNNTAQSK